MEIDGDWSQLTVEALLKVFSFLSPWELCQIESVCKFWEIYAKSNELWRALCNKYEVNHFIDKLDNNNNDTFFERYRVWHSQFKRCINVYPKLKGAVSRFDQFQKLSKLNLFTFGGVEYQAVKEIESELRVALKFEENESVIPDDLCCWYLMCNSNQPLMGCYSFYDHEVSQLIIPLPSLLLYRQTQRLSVPLIPFCVSPGVESKIIYFVAKDFGEYKRGNILCANSSLRTYFHVADSFCAWFVDHVKKCEFGYYSIQEGQINLFPRINVPIATTEGVTIQASPLYIPEVSRRGGNDHLWSYSIMITMADDVPYSSRCKLVSRYWEITCNGNTQVTQGPGVIGLCPDVYPGSVFSYESCCPLKSNKGTMGGHFTFRKPDGSIFNAIVPTMTFEIPLPITEEGDEFAH